MTATEAAEKVRKLRAVESAAAGTPEGVTARTLADRLAEKYGLAGGNGCPVSQTYETRRPHAPTYRAPEPHRSPAPDPAPEVDCYDRAEVIRRIRAGLRKRSGRAWSVTGGRGSSYGWISISALPRDCDPSGRMSDRDRALLARLLGLSQPCGFQGELVPGSVAYRREYIDRAEGRTPSVYGRPYWD